MSHLADIGDVLLRDNVVGHCQQRQGIRYDRLVVAGIQFAGGRVSTASLGDGRGVRAIEVVRLEVAHQVDELFRAASRQRDRDIHSNRQDSLKTKHVGRSS